MGASITAAAATELLSGCGALTLTTQQQIPFQEIHLEGTDEFKLASGFTWSIICTEGDTIGPNLQFGSHNDYTHFMPLAPPLPQPEGHLSQQPSNQQRAQAHTQGQTYAADAHTQTQTQPQINPNLQSTSLESQNTAAEGLLWVNHESITPLFLTGYDMRGDRKLRTKNQVQREQKFVGGSILHIRQNEKGQWQLVHNSKYNRRLDANTPIPFDGDIKIAGRNTAIGTLANCAGGYTPWGTFLTCEENYDNFYGETHFDGKTKSWAPVKKQEDDLMWWKFDKRPPEHYGWVVEIEPATGKAKKLVSLGRFSHEGATVCNTPSGRAVVYMGDDTANECLYKFVASQPGSLSHGELFVANFAQKKWLSLNLKKQPSLQRHYNSQLDVLTYTRFAAHTIGGTPLDRPEDIEIHPQSGHVYVALTGNPKNNNPLGSILKIKPENNDHLADSFEFETFINKDTKGKIYCPDNMAFDKNGNLWVCNDVKAEWMGHGDYKEISSNGLFYIPMSGSRAGLPHCVAQAPRGAEFTGIHFSLDGNTLFMSIQHPGENSTSLANLTSTFPHGDKSRPPLSCVVAICLPVALTTRDHLAAYVAL